MKTQLNIIQSTKLNSGSNKNSNTYQRMKIPFGKYEVIVLIDENGKFFDIEEIKINQDFMNFKQKAQLSSDFDVDKFYFQNEVK